MMMTKNICNCKTKSKDLLKDKSKSLLDKNFFLKRIVSELTAADPVCESSISNSLDNLWDISSAINGCNFYFNYLYTKSQATQILMGCYVREIDTKKGESKTNANGSTVKDENIESQSQSTNSSTSFSDAIGQNKFDDKGNSKTVYHSETIGRGWSYDYGQFDMNDKSFGSGQSVTTTDGTVINYRFNLNSSTTNGESSGSGYNSSCKSSTSFKRTKADGRIFPLLSMGASGFRGGSSKFSKDSNAGYKKGYRDGDTLRVANGLSKTRTQTDGENSSWNQQVVDELGWTLGAFDQWSRSKANREMTSHSDGFGTTQDEMRARNTGSSQGTAESKKILNAVVKSSKNGFMVMDDIKSHQRFLHMRQIYLNVELELKEFQKVLRGKQTPKSGKIYAYLGCEKFDTNLWCSTCQGYLP